MTEDEPDMTTPEIAIPWRINCLINELDDFNRMARSPETQHLFIREALAFDQMLTRVELILSAVKARKPELRAVS